MMETWAISDRRDAYWGALADWGLFPGGSIHPTKARTSEPEQVDRLLRAAQAPEALAMLSGYGHGVGLASGSPHWTTSCLPVYSGWPGYRRASTISITRGEIFYVWMGLKSGQVGDWGMVVDESDRDSLADDVLQFGGFSQTKHGLFVVGNGFESFATLVESITVRESAERTVSARREAGSVRQQDWHNSKLAMLLELDSFADIDDADPVKGNWEIPMSYALRLIASRRHQSKFRSKLLEGTTPRACAVCGLDVEQVLEAAHIVPDAKGGRASSDNAVLLCANHHRAMDRGMFVWTDKKPVWNPDETRF